MAKRRFQSTKFPGIRFRQHQTRKHGIQFDRYFSIYYRHDGKNYEEGVGWASNGWTLERVNSLLGQIKRNQRRGDGPTSLKAMREAEKAAEAAVKQKEALQERMAVTFGDFFMESYIPQAKHEKATWNRDLQIYHSHLQNTLSKKPLHEVVPLDLERIKRRMSKKGLSPRTIQYSLAIARRVFNVARVHKAFSGDNPVSAVRMPRVDNRRVRFLTHQEADELLDELLLKSLQMYVMALFSLHSGLRYGEIAALKWGDIDFENRTLLIRNSKKTLIRNCYMTTQMVEALSLIETGGGNDLIFPARNGGVKKEVSNVFARTVDSLGLNAGIDDRRQKVCFHTLRHTFASWHVMNGTDIFMVKELLGHKDIAMTQRYSHLAPGTFKKAAADFEKILENQAQTKSQPEKGRVQHDT